MNKPFDRQLRHALILLLSIATALAEVRAAPAVEKDPQLHALITEAVLNNPEVRAAKNEREAAQHRVSPAGALEDPMLEAGVLNAPVLATWRLNREDMTMKMLGVSQKLPFPGKRALRQDVAAKDAESIAHGYQETVNRVVRDITTSYFELAFVTESTRLVEKNKQVLEQFLQISESRYSVGQGNQSDVLKAQTQLSRMVDELIKLGRERRLIEAELARALGRGPEAGIPVPEALRLQDAVPQFDALRETAIKDRPQLLGLQSLIERSGKTLDLTRKDYYPDFDVKLAYGLRDKTREGLRRDELLSLTVAINLPVWQENKRDPRVAEAIAMRGQAIETYQAQLNELTAKLRQQIANAEQSMKSVRLYETGILPQARLAVESALSAYKVNRVDFLTLLDSQMMVLSYEVSRASALANHNKALAEIDLLIGKPGDAIVAQHAQHK